MGELTFFLGLQVMQRDDGIFISQDKYMADILKKFDFSSVKTASTLIETNNALLKDEEAEDVNVNLYRSMIGSNIEIRHHFIKDSYEKRLIQVIKIHTDHNVADLLTKAFDVSSDVFGVKAGSCKVSAARQKLVLLSKINDVKQIHAIVDGKTVVISESSVRSDLHFNDGDGITCLSNDEIFIDLVEPFNDVYVTPAHTKNVFTNMKRQNKDFTGTVTLLFASMLVPQVVKGEGSGQPFEPQPPSSTTPPSHEDQVTTFASQPQKTHTPRRTKRGRDTKIPQSSGPPKKVCDETVYTGEDDRVVRAATTATSLEAEQESGNINKTRSTTTLNESSPQGTGSSSGPRCQDITLRDADPHTRFETASKQSRAPPLLEFNASGSGEDSLEHLDDLTNFAPPTLYDSPLPGVLALEQSKTAQDLVIKRLQKKVKRLKNKQRARTPGMNLFKIGDIDDNRDDIDDMVDEAMENIERDTVNVVGAVNTTTTGVSAASVSVTTTSVSISTVEPRTPPTAITTVFKDEDLTIAQTPVKMRSEKAKEKGVAFRDVKESARPIKILPTIDPKDKGKFIMQEPEKPPKNPRIAQIQLDEELAKRMHEE
nr:ribonuclease H-like domain, reverse transcriptase, RNA-dependent DNA polymerase [Tanacetum cinerariifolium]